MPRLGCGVYQTSAEDTKRCVLGAVDTGCRSIDTAQAFKIMFSNPVLTETGFKHGRTAAQTAPRFLLRSGVAVIRPPTRAGRGRIPICSALP